MMRVVFLGTASSRPTVTRNVSCVALQREGELFLFDCGEGTQRQMMTYGVGFNVRDIFISHLHADHYLGITGLLRTLSLQGRTEPMRVWGPPTGRDVLTRAVELGGDRFTFGVQVRELEPGDSVRYEGYRVEAYSTEHTRTSIGFRVREDERPGRFDVERARELGVPEGPLFGKLHAGEPVTLDDGRTVEPAEVVGEPRPGRRVVYTGDTRPSSRTVEVAREADLLIHEATFGDAEEDRARSTAHSTAHQAADVARRAGVRRLALTHLSARYSEQPGRLRQEASRVFEPVTVASDGDVIEVPYPEKTEES